VEAVAFSPDGKLIASAGSEGIVQVWDTVTGKGVRQFTGDPAVWSLAVSGDGSLLASGDENGLIRIWEIATGQERFALRGHQQGIPCIAFCPRQNIW
jgi:WD40 repeat protein